MLLALLLVINVHVLADGGGRLEVVAGDHDDAHDGSHGM